MKNSKFKKKYSLSPVLLSLHSYKSSYQKILILSNIVVIGLVFIVVSTFTILEKYCSVPIYDIPLTSNYENNNYDFGSNSKTSTETKNLFRRHFINSEGITTSGYIPNILVARDLYSHKIDIKFNQLDHSIEGIIDFVPSQIHVNSNNDNYSSTYGNVIGEADWYLPSRPLLWQTTNHNLLIRNNNSITEMPILSNPPKVSLAEIYLEEDKMRFFSDTAIVEGILVLHTSGRVSLININESHQTLNFSENVRNAINNSFCVPAKNIDGKCIDVKIKYRCLIFKDGMSKVNIIHSEIETNEYTGYLSASHIKK